MRLRCADPVFSVGKDVLRLDSFDQRPNKGGAQNGVLAAQVLEVTAARGHTGNAEAWAELHVAALRSNDCDPTAERQRKPA